MTSLIRILAASLVASSLTACAVHNPYGWRTEFDRGQVAYDEGRFVDAYKIWLPLAEAGICKAEFAIGSLLEELTSFPPIPAEQVDAIEALLATERRATGFEYFYLPYSSAYPHDRPRFIAI